MKEYRILGWSELPAEFGRTAYRRVVSEMSMRYLTLGQLADVSGLKKSELRSVLEMLDSRGVLDERDNSAPDSFLDSIGRMTWFRRATPAARNTQ